MSGGERGVCQRVRGVCEGEHVSEGEREVCEGDVRTMCTPGGGGGSMCQRGGACA